MTCDHKTAQASCTHCTTRTLRSAPTRQHAESLLVAIDRMHRGAYKAHQHLLDALPCLWDHLARHLLETVRHRDRREWLEHFQRAHGQGATEQLKARLRELWSSMSTEDKQRDKRRRSPIREIREKQGRGR